MEEEIIINTSVKGSAKAEQQLDDVANATNDADDAAKEYENTIGDLASEMEVFGVSINGITGALKNGADQVGKAGKSFSSFNNILKASVIGLIVVALGALVAWLKSSEEGLLLVNKVMAGFEAVVKTALGTLGKLGGALVKFFKGDFSGAMKDAGDAVTGFADRVKSAVISAGKLEEILLKVAKNAGTATLNVAFLNEKISKQKLIIEDIDKTNAQRIAAQKESIRLIKLAEIETAKQLQLEKDAATIKLANQIVANDNAALEIELTTAAEVATAALTDNRTAANERLVGERVKLNELIKEGQDATTAAFVLETIQHKDHLTFNADEQQAAIDLGNVKVDADIKALDADNKLTAAKKANRAELDEIEKVSTQAQIEQAVAIFSGFAALADENSKFAKAAAILEIGLNTQKGVTAALNNGALPLVIAGIALALATGASAIGTVLSMQPPPKPGVPSEAQFGDGGLINGASHGGGGVWINAEGGEAVINKRSMAIPAVRAQVSYLNQIGGGVPIMARGGLVPEAPTVSPFINLERTMAAARAVLVTDDLRAVQQSELIVKVTTTL